MPLNGRLTKTETTALEQSWLSFEGALGPNQLLYDLDELLLTRSNGQGLKLYDALLNDAHTFAVLNKLSQAITSREWTVTPAADKRAEKKAADLVREQLTWLNARNLNPGEENHSSITGFDSLTRAFVIGGVLNGRHFAEVMWGTSGTETAAIEVRSRDPRQFAFAKGQHGYVLRHMTREHPVTGVEVPLKKVLVWSHGGLDGNPYGRALGRVLWWPVWFKRNGIRFWLKFVERFAAPKPTGKYPRGATRDQIAELRAALGAIANETEIAIPDGMLIEYLEAAQSGTIDTYESLCKYMDDQISRAVLGETGTTDQTGSGGSRARDQVADGIRLEGAKAIADSLSTTFNRLAAWITEFNYPGVTPPTIWRVFDNQEDLDARVNRDKTLFDLGYRLNAEAVASVYGEGYEQSVTDGEKPALISQLGVGGTQALTGLLQQAATGQLPKENAIAVLVSVFGIDEADAKKMVPDAPKESGGGGELKSLFGGQNDEAFAEQARYPKGDPRGGQFAPKVKGGIQASFSSSTDKKVIKAAFLEWEESIKKLKAADPLSHETKIKYYKSQLEELNQKPVNKKQFSQSDLDDYIKKELSYERAQNNRFFDDDPDLPDYVERLKSRFLKKFEKKDESKENFEKESELKKKLQEEEGKLKAAKKAQAELGFSEQHSQRIASLIAIHEQIKLTMSSPNSKFVGVFDEDGNLQAISNITKQKGHVYIDYLVTAPHNLIPGDSRATKGAGSAVIESVIKLSAESGRGGKINLTALHDAVPFYEKIGFKVKEKTSGLPKMSLSSESAREFFANRGKTADFAEDDLDSLETKAMGALASLMSPLELLNARILQEASSFEAAFAEDERDAVDQIADKARQGVQDAIAPWLATVREFVEKATTIEEIRDGLIDLYPELDDAAFAEAMGQAIVLADLTGREEVLGEVVPKLAEWDAGDIEFAEMVEAAIGGTLDFAAKKKPKERKRPNCNPAKSHFCQTPNGRGSCVPLAKRCRYKPKGEVKAASDYVSLNLDSSGLPKLIGSDIPEIRLEDLGGYREIRPNNFPVTSEQFAAANLEDFNPSVKGMNSLFKTTIDGKDYFVKRSTFADDGQTAFAAAEFRNEVAAKRIADALGYGDRVLDVAVMQKEGETYVVSPLITGEAAARSRMTISKYIGRSAKREKEIQETMVLDYVLASRDRHRGNVFYQTQKMILIDNGLAFGDGYHWDTAKAESVYYSEFTNNTNEVYSAYNSIRKRRTGNGIGATPIPQDIKENIKNNRENILAIAKEIGVPEQLLANRLDHLESSEFFGQLVTPPKPKYVRPKRQMKFMGQQFSNTEDLLNAIDKLYLD